MTSLRWTRRRALVALGAMPASLTLPSFAGAAQPPAGPPVARRQPVTETLWGEQIIDPYRWMEDPKDTEWESFMKGQAAHARRVLDAIPGRKALYERVTQLSGGVPIARVRGSRARWRKSWCRWRSGPATSRATAWTRASPPACWCTPRH